MLALLFTGLQVAHQQGLARLVDLNHIVEDPHIDVETALETLGSLQQQGIPVGDIAPDVIGQTAVGEADKLASLEHHDLCLFTQTTSTSRRRCAPPQHHR